MKFKSPIEVQSSIKDSGNSPGSAGQVLTSTVNGVDWVDQGAIAAESAEVVEVPVKNTHTTTILKGTPVYISGSVGSSGRLEVKPANASVEASMPALGLLKQDLAVNAEGFCVISGKLRNLITSPIDGVNTNEGDVVYVKAGGGLTTTKPGGADNFIQNMGKVGVSSTSNNGTFIVSSILRSNDVPNLPEGRLFVGTSDNTSLTSDVVYIDDTNDRVGIGTDSPAKKLHVQHSSINPSSVYGTLLVEENNEASVGILGTSYSSVYFGDAASPYTGGIIYAHSDNHLEFRVSGNSEKMRITSSGNVGIGVTSPGAKLDVAGGARISVSGGTSSILELRNDNDGDSFVRYYDEGSGDAWSAGLDTSDSSKFKIAYGQDSDSLTVGTKMVIQTNGNVGIGTTGPGYKLDVNGGGGIRVKDASNPLIYFSRTNGVNGGIGMTDDTTMRFAVGTAGLGSNTKMVIQTNGRVGIGTTSPGQMLDVSGNIKCDSLYINGPSIPLYFEHTFYGTRIKANCNGLLVQNGSTYYPVYASAFSVQSDYRLKSNVVPLDNAIDRFKTNVGS